MAFTGSAVIKQVSDSIVRITGLSLGATASGTIGLAGHTGSAPNVTLPPAFQPKPYGYGGATVELQDSIDATSQLQAGGGDPIPVSVVKTGTTEGDFRITFSNTFASQTFGLEIYIKFHE